MIILEATHQLQSVDVEQVEASGFTSTWFTSTDGGQCNCSA